MKICTKTNHIKVIEAMARAKMTKIIDRGNGGIKSGQEQWDQEKLVAIANLQSGLNPSLFHFHCLQPLAKFYFGLFYLTTLDVYAE